MDLPSVVRCPLLRCLLLLLLLAVVCCSAVHHHFRSPTPFQHLIVDRSTSTLYAAATNALYQLDGQDLSPVETTVVGPVQDHPLCTEEFGRTQCSAGGTLRFDTQATDNVNKVFVVDAAHRQIIACGSVFQGVCETRSLSNISVVTSGSNVRANTDYFIAANNPAASTVAFAGRGPSGRTVLYVASTYTGTTSTSVRQTVPAVSSRSLDPGPDLFRFTYVDGLTGGTLLRLRSEAIEKYPVEYVSGFRAGGFAYFLTNQRDGFQLENFGTPPTIAPNFGSRIAQVCENDRSFYSYVEMPLRCAGLDYNLVRASTVLRVGGDDLLAARLKSDAGGEDVLVMVFVRSRDNSDVPTSTSAVCLYRLADVRRKFVENVRKCFSGEQRHVGSQFSNRMCVSLGLRINESYCGEAEQNGPLVGNVAIDSTPIVTYSNSQLTAVAALSVNRLAVLYLGTSDGHLKKVALQADGTWQEFNETVIEAGSSINQDMLIDSNSSSLFVMTTNTIVKMSVTECEQYTNCESCRSAGDPHCGWCALERKCSTKASCLDSTFDDRWLSQTAWECIRVPPQFVSPARIGVRSNLQISVGIKALPLLKPSEKYLCVFGTNSTVVVGRVSPNEVKCQFPPITVSQTAIDDHVNVTLFIKSSRTQVNFVDTNLTIFDCSKHISCTTCSQSMWGCSWCIGLNKCLQPDNIHACPAPLITDRQMCPQLKYLPGSSILIPFDISTEIPLSAAFLPSVAVSQSSVSGYECLVHLTSPPVRVPAHRINDSVLVCDKFQYTFEAPEPLKTVSLEVVWNNSFVIDDNYGITVTVYHCESMANDCSICLSLREAPQIVHYNCQWCGVSCQFNGTCNSSQLLTNTICPLPHIEQVHPLAGPLEGGTRVTIKGTNLGRSFDQVRWSVTVATLPCEVIESEYIISHQIVCTTSRYVGGSLTGDIVVTIDGSPVTWINTFTYQNPEVLDFSPVVGPKAGGTKVTIEGQKLNTGAMIRVMFDDVPCLVEHVNPNGTVLVCTTMPVPNAEILPVAVHFDRIRQILDMEFEFTDNPTITKILPLTSFVGGGRTITVSGTNFHSIQQPLMHLSDWTHNYTTQCQVKEDTLLHCPTPTIGSSHRTKRSDDRLEFIVSFTMDGVETVRNLPQYFPTVNYTITTFSDPVYTAFENGLKIYKGEALILTGQNLNTACRLDEVTVSIGNATCKVNSVDATTLYCSPPAVQPTGSNDDPHQLPLVKVRVGKLVYELGRLKYQKLELLHSDDQWIIIIVAGACGGTLLTLIVIIVAVYKRKSTRAERQFTKLQVQLDALESNIRHECKQAFAELQTEVIDFTSDLNIIGIPFWDYRSYTFKVLFPSFVDHPILLQNNVKTSNPNGFEDCLSTFYQLLNIDQFLLIFIQTLEEQKTFGIRDKSMVASLLMVIFQDKMEYATEILKVLLNDLIEKSLERKTPKLLLRRTESVVEKLLTNWLSLCMYPYLKTYANKPLFMLYKAIKHQTEKGPIDSVTAEARYSLSEDRLLREKTESHSMTVYLLSPHNDGREPIACKMLNCDTVTQAKEKALDAIYMNTPFSRRPSVHDLDLVLVGSKRGTHVLRDEDHSSVVIKSWRRLNTLAHYQVADGATLALQPRQLHNGTGKNGTMKHHHNGKFDSSNGTLPVNVSTPILAIEDGSKLFHLTRHDDGVHNAIRGQKVISEIFLTRLLATKCTLQQYVDDLFATILRVDTELPSAVKYLFDFLDCAAVRHNITDPDVVHTWKSNSLLLRFWVNIIKNPEFLFDVNKSHIVDSCLSVVAQTFMDSCSTHEQRLGKDSPSSKLLYAKDIPRYRRLVSEFYKGVEQLPAISDLDMALNMSEHSVTYATDLNVEAALQELMVYARQYRYELLEALDDNSIARRLQLGVQFEHLSAIINEQSSYC